MNKKWVAVWSTAPSFSEQRIENYCHDVTLRYKIHTTVAGEKIRLTFSNHVSKEEAILDKISVAPMKDDVTLVDKAVSVTFGGDAKCKMAPGETVVSDEIDFGADAGDDLAVTIYIGGYVNMAPACSARGPYSKNRFCRGDSFDAPVFDKSSSNEMGYCYFLTEVDLLADEKCRSIIAYGDSITAQSWPEWLIKTIEDNGVEGVAVARRAVSGSRVLRQYDCVPYCQYGLKGADRFVREIKTAGADTVVILHGVNDIIHPQIDDNTGFRPIEHLPTAEELIEGLRFYIKAARDAGLKVYMGTLIGIKGWRSYADFREPIRLTVNEWIRTAAEVDGVIDFDLYLRDSNDELQMQAIYDSGDHLHPSDEGAKRMAEGAFEILFK